MPGRLPTSSTDDSIDATPTKRFFIEMLVRDIELLRAIADLVDNSVDGARFMKGADDSVDFNGLRVDLNIHPDQFIIEDNCGGIPTEIARDYAFRFGRAEGTPSIPHSVGQFGVGMKRAIFKLGRWFRVESQTSNSWFVVEEDVDAWESRPEWNFKFSRLPPGDPPLSDSGTRVTVGALNQPVSDAFTDPFFVRSLKGELEAAHQRSMAQGLAISINGYRLETKFNSLLGSDQIKPAYRALVLGPDREYRPVTVQIYAGLIESAPQSAGWDVFCNGRLVLEADQSQDTGWGEGAGATIPRFHNQFARFKGYVFFDCIDAGLLPWNTTKTGVDTDSPVYQAARQIMIEMMRPLITFLNNVDRELDPDVESTPLSAAIAGAEPTRLSAFDSDDLPGSFVAPRPPREPAAVRVSRIAYNKPADQVAKAKAVLGVSILKDVGERTFDYFYELEVDD